MSFKPNTDDMRFAPALDIILKLQERGAKVRAYDPVATPKAKKMVKNVVFTKNPYDACRGANCMVITTEWDEFKNIDMKKIKKLLTHPIVIDGRNIYDPKKLFELGFIYKGVGR